MLLIFAWSKEQGAWSMEHDLLFTLLARLEMHVFEIWS